MINFQHIILKYNIIPFIIFFFIFFIGGCETAKIQYVEADNLPKEGVVRITEVFLKTSGSVYVYDKNPKLDITGKSKGIVYDSSNSKQNFIPLNSISQLKIEVASNNYWMPVVIIGGAAILIVILLIIAFNLRSFGG